MTSGIIAAATRLAHSSDRVLRPLRNLYPLLVGNVLEQPGGDPIDRASEATLIRRRMRG